MKTRKIGWLSVALAMGVNAVLILILTWLNRPSGLSAQHEEFAVREIFRAEVPPLEPEPIDESSRVITDEVAPMQPATIDVELPRAFEPRLQPAAPPIPLEFDRPNVTFETGPLDASRVEQAPRKLSGAPPEYPSWAKSRQAQGTATICYVIEADGTVGKIEIQQVEGDERFGSAARDAVSRWRFQPAMHRGKPVPVLMTQRFRFQLVD
jgi:protein TonB